MLFNSYIFVLVFLPVILLIYYGFGHRKKYFCAKILLFLASLVFYAYNNIYYLLIILFSLVANYAISMVMTRMSSASNMRKVWLVISLFVNLGILFYFKYFDFFLENINIVFGQSFHYINILLPLGISFYTFQQISYVVDVYNYKAPQYSFIEYALFVTFFPQLIAGPIALHSEMVPQFQDEKIYHFNSDKFAQGVYFFSIGLAKKVLIADKFGEAVAAGYGSIADLSTIEAWIIMLSYTIQIYFDFSGYCDMAQGIANMFNIELPINFNSPYKSKSITEFWQRWHITLGRFLKEYVYFPLGGNRKGIFRTYVNLFIVFLVSGFWHGANWTFIIWGAFHGFFRCLHKATSKYYDRIYGWIRCLVTFLIINVAWVLFRANTVKDALSVLKRLVVWNGGSVRSEVLMPFHITGMNQLLERFFHFCDLTEITFLVECSVWTMFALLIIFFGKNIYEQKKDFSIWKALLSILCIVLSVLSFSKVTTFLYFNF